MERTKSVVFAVHTPSNRYPINYEFINKLQMDEYRPLISMNFINFKVAKICLMYK